MLRLFFGLLKIMIKHIYSKRSLFLTVEKVILVQCVNTSLLSYQKHILTDNCVIKCLLFI